MKLYVFENATRVSDSYHDSGSLLVVARDRDAVECQVKRYNDNARKMWGAIDDHIALDDDDWDRVRVWDLAGDAPEYIVAFPDAGCC